MCLSGAPNPSRRDFLDGAVHGWYRTVMGYSDELVGQLLDLFGVRAGQRVLDPFCGSGTTLVECMKRGIDCVGIDASPASCFASRVKTQWRLRSSRLLELLEEIENSLLGSRPLGRLLLRDPTTAYLTASGMIERGWISPEPLRKAIAVKECIRSLRTTHLYKDALMLALLSEVVDSASNVKFGPELYCGPAKVDSDVVEGFSRRVRATAKDLDAVSRLAHGTAQVLLGDSRECHELLERFAPRPYDAVICSPPYPAEHDYTRNSRLVRHGLELDDADDFTDYDARHGSFSPQTPGGGERKGGIVDR